jgi:hypothetical protein
MMPVFLRGLASATLFLMFLIFPGCGADQRLAQITVTPATFEIDNASGGETIQFRALGLFIHPPEQRDITAQVVWASPSPDVIDVDATGKATVAGLACGASVTNLPITATASTNLHMPPSGNVLVGTATVTIKFPACP